MSEKEKRWLSIKEAARRAGKPVWTMRRWLKRMNDKNDGRLLDHGSTTGKVGKYLVDAQVLDEIVFLEREKRRGMNIREEVELALQGVRENAEAIDILDLRTQAHTKRIRSQGGKVENLSRKVTSHDEVLSELNKALELIGGAAKKLATGGCPESFGDNI